MSAPADPPFSSLTPDRILNALESCGLRPDGRLLALNSYENRVYQVGMDDDGMQPMPTLVVKFYRAARWDDAQILEEHAFAHELAQREIPVVAALPFAADETLQRFEDLRFAIYPKCGGRAPELESRETLEWMGRFLGRIHAVGALSRFEQRPHLDVASFGEASLEYLLSQNFIPPELLQAWSSVVEQALDGVRRCYERAGSVRTLRLHGDCHASNVLWIDQGTQRGPHFVDFDDSRMGPAVQDLWMLLSGERETMTRQLHDILSGYEDFFEFDPHELRLIEALRTLRLIHYSAWLARRWDDPAFPVAFPWFNTQRYWQDRILELREQIALMDEAPLAVG